MWLEFVVGSRPCSDVLLPVLRFSSFLKTNIRNSCLIWIEDPHENHARADVHSSLNTVIYFVIYFFNYFHWETSVSEGESMPVYF